MNTLNAKRQRAPLFDPFEAPEPDAWTCFRRDLARYLDVEGKPGLGMWLRTLIEMEGLWAVAVYRLGRHLHTTREKKRGLERALLSALYALSVLFIRVVLDVHLDVRAQIGPGLYVGHFKSIHVGPGVRMGRDCNLGQMVFVTAAGPGFEPGAPVIGDRVYLGVGAKVMGPVTVGDDAAVGANAVVLEDVPPNAVVVGNPARIANLKGSASFLTIHPKDPATSGARVELRS